MKVLRILHNLGLGGVQRQLLSLVPHLQEEMEIHICTLQQGGILEEEFRKLGVKVHNMDLGWKYSPLGIARLSRLISQEKYDVVHVHRMESIVFPAVVASLGAKVPVIIHHHFLYRWLSRRKLLLEAWATQKAQRLLAVSHPVMEHACRELGIEARKVGVVYNGISPYHHSRDSGHPWTVGMVARMVRHKRVDTFLKGAALLASLLNPVRFRLVGGGEREKRYLKMAQKLNLDEVLTFTGHTLEVEKEMNRFTVGVLPSENEGFPNTLLEYCASGLPMVVSYIPQNMEVIEAGREGKVIPPGDVNALASSSAEILSNRASAKKMGIMAMKRVQRFSLDHTLKSLLSYYKSFLGDKALPKSP